MFNPGPQRRPASLTQIKAQVAFVAKELAEAPVEPCDERDNS